MAGGNLGQVLHVSALTTEAVGRAIRNRKPSLKVRSARCGFNQKAVVKWRKRTSVAELPTGPKDARLTVLTRDGEAMIVALRRHTLLPLDAACSHRNRWPRIRWLAGEWNIRPDAEPVNVAPLAERAMTSAACPEFMATSLQR